MQKKYLKVLIMMSSIFYTAYTFSYGGFYMGAGAGYANISNSLQNSLVFNDGATGSKSVNGVASTVYFGYNFNNFVGIEVDYKVAFRAKVENSYSVQQQLAGASMLGRLPFGLLDNHLSGLSFFAKLGLDHNAINFFSVQSDCNNCVNPQSATFGFRPTYGLGLEYDFSSSQSFGVRGEWNNITKNLISNEGIQQLDVGTNMYLLSILYNF